MCFSLDLINFSGADSLHMIYSAELFAVLIRIKAVLITLSVVAGIPQGLYRGRTCQCVNALVSSRNANETSPWGDGNLADKGVIKYFSNFKNSCTICILKKWIYNHKLEIQ